MTAILGGLGAAVMWATSTLSTSRSTKLVSPVSVLASVMTIGALITAPFALGSGVPDALGGKELAWLVTSGLANLVGLLLAYSALRVGKVGVVAPITSAQGAAAAIIAMLAGERIAAGSGVMLAVIVGGVALASLSRAAEGTDGEHDGRGAMLAAVAALLFGLGLYASGRLADDLPVAWILFVPRLLGTLVFAAPMALLGRVHMTGRAFRFVLVSGVCEILGLATFTLGAREGIAVTAVISSQFAALAAIVAYFAFGERLRRVQVAGVAAILLGVAVLTGLQA
jgi:drug/metabolite transporter (DMT)-like permease